MIPLRHHRRLGALRDHLHNCPAQSRQRGQDDAERLSAWKLTEPAGTEAGVALQQPDERAVVFDIPNGIRKAGLSFRGLTRRKNGGIVTTTHFGYEADKDDLGIREEATETIHVIYQDKNTIFQITCPPVKRVQRMGFLS